MKTAGITGIEILTLSEMFRIRGGADGNTGTTQTPKDKDIYPDKEN